MKTKAKQSAETWLSIKGQFAYETNGFRLNLGELTDEELTSLKPVDPEFLEFAPHMFNVIHPKHHTELRKIIAYLTELQRLQCGAWERKIEGIENDNENEKIEKWLQRHSTDTTKR